MAAEHLSRVERLSPRQRECLRLVFARKKTGQIADVLSLSQGTVNGYIAEAVKTLGARDRVDAAEQLAAWETAENAPEELQGQYVGVVEPTGLKPAEQSGSSAPWWQSLAPFRSKGSHGNELGILARLLWIPLLALIFALGFGALADTVRVASVLVAGR